MANQLYHTTSAYSFSSNLIQGLFQVRMVHIITFCGVGELNRCTVYLVQVRYTLNLTCFQSQWFHSRCSCKEISKQELHVYHVSLFEINFQVFGKKVL